MNWIKSLSIWSILAAIGAAVIWILNAKRSGKMEANIEHSESRIKELNKGTDSDIQQAKILQQDIKIKKVKAKEVLHKSEAALERLGEDETMADIATRFNNKRVRRRSAPIAPIPGGRKKSGKRNLSN